MAADRIGELLTVAPSRFYRTCPEKGLSRVEGAEVEWKAYLDANAYTHYVEKRPYEYRVLMAPVLRELMQSLSGERARALLRRLPLYVHTPESAAYLAINVVGFAVSLGLMLAIGRRALPRRALAVPAVYLALAYSFLSLLRLAGAFVLTVQSLRSATTNRAWAITGAVGFAMIFPVGQIAETRAFADLMAFFAVAIAGLSIHKPCARVLQS